MAFTNKPNVSLTIDQILGIVDQLSPADTLKVAKRIKVRNKNADLDDLIAIFSKVKSRGVSTEKQKVLNSVRVAVKEMKQVKAGKLKGRPVQALLNEL